MKKTGKNFSWKIQLDKNLIFKTAILVLGFLPLSLTPAWSLDDGKTVPGYNQTQLTAEPETKATPAMDPRSAMVNRYSSWQSSSAPDLPGSYTPPSSSYKSGSTLFNFTDAVSLVMGSEADVTALDPQLEKKLETPVTIDYHGVSCEHVFHLIAEMTGLNVTVDPEVRNRPIDISLNNVSLREAVNLICASYGLDVIATGHVLYVVAQSKLDKGTFKSVKLNNITAHDAQDLVKGMIGSTNASKESNTIVLVGTPGEISRARDIIEAADQSQEQPSASKLVKLTNINVEEAKSLIKDVITTVNSSNQANSVVLFGAPGQISKAEEILKAADSNQATQTNFKLIKLVNLAVDDAKTLVKDVISTANTSKEINSIILTGTSGQISKAEAMLKEADTARPQVMLEAKIIEIGKQGEKDLGIDWLSSGAPGTIPLNLQEGNRSTLSSGTAETNVLNPAKIFRLSRDPIAFATTIHMLETKSEAKTLSSPSISTLNNKEAQIFVGDSIPYTVTTVAGGYASTDVRFVEPGIRLVITPSVIENDFVVIKIQPEVSYIYSWVGPNKDYPWVKKRTATAYVRVKNNTTFIMGGILDKEDKKSLYMLPMIGKIPLIGNLFKYESHSTTDSDLIISVTPRVVRGYEQENRH